MSNDDKGPTWILPALAGTVITGVLWATTGEAKASDQPSKPDKRRRGGCTCEKYLYLFREFGLPLGIPPTYLQALACRESSCNPLDSKDPAWGLMQITGSVRGSEPRLDGKSGIHLRDELLDPRVSVYLCTRTLGRAIRTLKALGLPPRWTDPKWVGLLTAGWNAGYSRSRGLGLVVKHLLDHGWRASDIDIDAIHTHAERAGGIKYLWQYPKRPKWWRSVVRLYFKLAKQKGLTAR